MADKKSVGHAYNVDFLNVVFAASSLFLFLSVIWMVWDDFDRDWKKTQRSFSQLETQAKLKDADNALFRATTAFQTMKATYDQDRYDFEATRANGQPFAKKEALAKDEERQLHELDLAREKAEADVADVQKQLGQYTGEVVTVQKSIDEINAEQDRLRKRLTVTAPSLRKDSFRT